MKNSHCSHCGSAFSNTDWPRVCPSEDCAQLLWQNPTPVVVVLQPVTLQTMEGTKTGAVIARRAIEPGKGEWSLISGYMDVGETAEEAAIREFREETGLEPSGVPRYVCSRYNASGLLMLCFVVDEAMPYATFCQYRLCPENSEIGIYTGDSLAQFAFPLQSEFTHQWLRGDFS